MDAGQYAVRFRSEAGLMLEYAIAGDVLQEVQGVHGARLERLKDRTGARIEVQELFKKREGVDDLGPRNTIHSILISGSFKEVVDAFNALKGNHATQPAKTDGSASTPQETSEGKPGSAQNTPKLWRMGPILSNTYLPSSNIKPGRTAIRSRTEDHIALEHSIDAATATRWRFRYGDQLEFLKWRYGGEIVVKQIITEATGQGQDESQPTLTQATQSPHSTVYLAGPWQTVSKIWDDLNMCNRAFRDENFAIFRYSTNYLRAGSDVFRRLADESLELVVAFTESQWQQVMPKTAFLRLAEALKLTMSTETTELRAESSDDKVQSRLVTLTGPKEALSSMQRAFKLIKKEMSKDESVGTTGRSSKTSGEDRKTIDVNATQASDQSQGMSQNRDFTSLVEVCPPGEQHNAVRAYVSARVSSVRRYSKASILSLKDHRHLQLIQGSEGCVEQAKAMFAKVAAKGYQKCGVPSRGIRVIHERHDWTPFWPELDFIVAQLSGNPAEDQTHDHHEPLKTVYRCTVSITGHGKQQVLQSFQTRYTAEQLKSATGCQDVVFLNDSFVAHGSLQSVLRFRLEVSSAMERERERLSNSLVKISSRVHASLSSVWANMPDIDAEQDLSREKAAQLADDVRLALRPLSHPVVLITSQVPRLQAVDDTNNEENAGADVQEIADSQLRRSRGITVSSFNTVAFRPRPIVSFNVKVPSRSWDAISTSGEFRVHLLTATSTGAAIADTFTKRLKEPHDGFLQLEKLGAEIISRDEDAPPRVIHKEGVLAELHAKLLPERCVKAGDHVIVVGRLVSCQLPGEEDAVRPSQVDPEFWDSIGGLAYAKQEYRNVGAEVKKKGTVLLPEDLPDPLSLGDEFVRQEASRSPLNLRPEQRQRSDTASPTGGDQRAVASAEHVDFEEAMGSYEDDLSPAAREEEDDYDFGFETPNYGVKRDQRSSPSTRESSQADAGDLWGPEDVVREDSIRLGGDPQPGNENSSGEGTSDNQLHRPAPPNTNTHGSRTFSTMARPINLNVRSTRQFSTKISFAQESAHGKTDLDQFVEPSARKMNVADYLGVPEDARLHSHRVRSLFRMDKDARRAEKRLLDRDNELTEDEKTELRLKVTTNNRIISKKLAWNAAYHLRIMLDKGRVDFKRAQFLESAIEKGQSVLLEEASLAKDMYDQGRINFEQLQKVKQGLARNADVYQTELTRLGQVVDEEGDGATGFPGVEEGSGDGFDGFRGNR
ncbi:hypothetical protein M409DRAFT_55125 [Zasmidium cellare ATCC 36951]|uniref:Flavin reductase like domain-containing protein n=1 Tax=Zasmidium cellare ATCC 36951 TaxID=1080233 RepID=A0A6A6CJZ6_ZASCE|nr:uncharacterized protein M409DRAFT_55125 [Zasmidium cellare ATCC 36951]KAF2166272.1 hypothetical protein M409DRAFT_55125 [Zasmidium cellare ATCC 36951]